MCEEIFVRRPYSGNSEFERRVDDFILTHYELLESSTLGEIKGFLDSRRHQYELTEDGGFSFAANKFGILWLTPPIFRPNRHLWGIGRNSQGVDVFHAVWSDCGFGAAYPENPNEYQETRLKGGDNRPFPAGSVILCVTSVP